VVFEIEKDPDSTASTLMPPELTTWVAPLTTNVPLAIPPARIVSLAGKTGPTPEPVNAPEIVALRLTPPLLTTCAPPLMMKDPLAVPPALTFSTPPLLSVVALARPASFSTLPELTVVDMVVPPAWMIADWRIRFRPDEVTPELMMILATTNPHCVPAGACSSGGRS